MIVAIKKFLILTLKIHGNTFEITKGNSSNKSIN